MSGHPSPGHPTDPDLYEQLLRERYGNPETLARELTGYSGFAADYTRPPQGAGAYAEEHTRILRRIAVALPDGPQQLGLIGAGGVAHVLVSRGPVRAETLCGKVGPVVTAGDDMPVCRVCAIA